MVIRAVLRQHLEGEGYRVVEAVNGPNTIEMMRHHRPDMVLLDIEMPGLNGHEVLRKVKADSTQPWLRVCCARCMAKSNRRSTT